MILASLLLVLPQAAPATDWTDALELRLEGRAWDQVASPYDRLPARAKSVVRDPVWNLSRHSAGMVVGFRTDAPRIDVRWELTSETLAMPHMPATGVSGVDLYMDFEGDWRWLACGKPTAVTNQLRLADALPAGRHDFLLYLPLYNGIRSLAIGVPAGSSVAPLPERSTLTPPMVFYGTSITQGGCASRPGMVHVAQLGRHFDLPVINLGFSGNGRMDLELADLLAEIEASVYLIDCLPNMNAQQVAERTVPFVRRLRELQPDTPILLVEDRSFANAWANQSRRSHHAASRRALRAAFTQLRNAGVEQIHYLPGAELLGDDSEATVDGSHPTDLGFVRQTEVFAGALEPLLAPRVAPPAPFGAIPSAAQLRWQRLETYAFVHFNMNTFTGAEWGHGDESPSTFAPTALDCRQWARVCRDAGMKAIILTAKHHDGFCLWPSAHTEHDVAASVWRDGHGDVLADLSAACEEFGLRFGVYLSPWDRNHPLYGSGEAYNRFFAAQLDEVLGNYGKVFEVWFDGANGEGPNGKRQVYDWDLFHDAVYRNQPEAIIFSDGGPGCRWVGNERGYAGETNWSTLNAADFAPGTPNSGPLNEGQRGGSDWVPAECDVSIRPGWYYHAAQDDQVKSLQQLLDIYHASVGRNANLLLNLPVDRRGLVHEHDAAALHALRRALDQIYAHDLAPAAQLHVSAVRGDDPRYGAARMIDGDLDTWWCPDDGVTHAELVLEWPTPQVFDRLTLQEGIALGQRVARFSVDVQDGSEWREIATATTIGHKRILRFAPQRSRALRVRILESLACPVIAEIAVHAGPPRVQVVQAEPHFLASQEIVLATDRPDAEIHYTLDGSTPGPDSPLYDHPFQINRSITLRAIAIAEGQLGLEELHMDLIHYRPEDLRPATHFIRAPDSGLRFQAYESGWQTLDQLANAVAVAEGIIEVPSLAARSREENFALQFQGWIKVPADGVFSFATRSDDGSRLWIGDTLVVDNDGLHGMIESSGQIALAAGFHPLRIAYFNARGDMGLEVLWKDSASEWAALPAHALFH